MSCLGSLRHDSGVAEVAAMTELFSLTEEQMSHPPAFSALARQAAR